MSISCFPARLAPHGGQEPGGIPWAKLLFCWYSSPRVRQCHERSGCQQVQELGCVGSYLASSLPGCAPQFPHL